jgi:hypothetical protein
MGRKGCLSPDEIVSDDLGPSRVTGQYFQKLINLAIGMVYLSPLYKSVITGNMIVKSIFYICTKFAEGTSATMIGI